MSDDTFIPFAIVQSRSFGLDIAQEAANRFPEGTGIGDKADALRHIVWSAEMTRKYGEDFAKNMGNWHESNLPRWMGGAGLPIGGSAGRQSPEEKQMDLMNNALGIQIGKSSESLDEIYKKATEAIESNQASILPKPRKGYY